MDPGSFRLSVLSPSCWPGSKRPLSTKEGPHGEAAQTWARALGRSSVRPPTKCLVSVRIPFPNCKVRGNDMIVTTLHHCTLNQFSSVHLLSCVWLLAAPWTAACQVSLSITNSRSLPNSCPLSQWCHPTILSSAIPFSSRLQSFSALGSLDRNIHCKGLPRWR